MENNDRENWYRIEQRERLKAPCPKLDIGSWITHRRTIVRAGYWLEPQDLSIEEALDAARKHFAYYMNEWLEKPDIQSWAWRHHPLRIKPELSSGPFSPDTISVACSILGVDEEYLLRHLAYRIRGNWLGQEKLCVQPHPTFLRTFWYIEHAPVSSQVYGTVSRKIGAHIPGGGYGDYDEYDPPAFDEWISQSIYHTGYQGIKSKKNRMLYVHPLDVETI